MRIVQLTERESELPVYLVAEHIVGVIDRGFPTQFEEDGVTVIEEAFADVRILLNGAEEVSVMETAAVALAAVVGNGLPIT